MATRKHILIIGGGIAGPLTALALHKAGISSTIYEAYETTADGVGGMLVVAPNGLDALRIVDVDTSGLGQAVPRMVMQDARGKRLGEFAGLPGLPASRAMLRSELYRALHDQATAHGIRIESGKRLVRVEESSVRVVACFADGSAATGDALVGADGIRSTVRTLVDPEAPGPSYVGLLGFGGYATGLGPVADSHTMHFAFGERAFFGYWTEPGGRSPWFSNLPHPSPLTLAQAREVSPADWLAQLRAQHADDVPGRELVEHTSPDQLLVLGGLEIMPKVPRWHRGRMVLVGDAAHAPSSSSGQGASLAAESAIQLARCLRDLPDVETAFAAYEALRRPRVERVAADAARVNSTKALGPVAKAVMRVLMPIAMKTFLKPERRFGPVHGYRIDWEQQLDGVAVGKA